jgi:glycosyltransferase involved in cell wall biosynthesis
MSRKTSRPAVSREGGASGKPCIMQLVLDLGPGGTQRLAIEIVKRLSDGFRMVVCCLDDAGEWAGELTDRGVPVVALHRSPGFQPAIGARVARLAAEHQAAVIHAHHYSPFVYGRIASLLNRRISLLFTEHGRLSDAPPVMKQKVVNTLLTRFSGPIFAVSAALRTHMVAQGFPGARVGVIHNGIDTGHAPTETERCAARRLLGAGEDEFVVGTAARLDTVKDLPMLVAAIARARSQVAALKLVIIGDGDERRAIEAAVRDRHVEDAVRIMGYRSDVRSLLPGLDLYVNSSISEGISLTILEAMAAALPVVATRVGGTPEVVLHQATGLLVEPRLPEGMADAIVDLAHAPERRHAFAAAGRARVEACFTLDRMVADYAREYERLESH